MVGRWRLAYRRRRDRLVAVLARSAPGVHVTAIAAGLHALLELRPAKPKTMWSPAPRGTALPSKGYVATAPQTDPIALP